MPITMDSPRTPSIKYSKCPNDIANFAMNPAAAIKMRAEIIPPIIEAQQARPKALPASPRLAMGYPSNMVQIAAGVPGVLIKIAGMLPANTAEQYKAMRKAKAVEVDMLYEKGTNKATPIVAEKPGNAPMKYPATVPAISAKI
jgi:hypothetical protein